MHVHIELVLIQMFIGDRLSEIEIGLQNSR
jgi:hypothetical protein